MGAITATEVSVTYLRAVLCNFSDRDSGSYKSGRFCSQGSFPKKAQLVFIPFLQFAARVA